MKEPLKVKGFIAKHPDNSQSSVGVFEDQSAFIITMKRPITDEMLQASEVKTREAFVSDMAKQNVYLEEDNIVREIILRPESFYAILDMCMKTSQLILDTEYEKNAEKPL